jgi:DNA-binding SARP family transcriptional activator
MIDIRCFGTFELSGPEGRLGPADLGGPKPRRLLQLLVLARGALVSKTRLLDEIWGARRRPANPAGTIESYISGLRKAAQRIGATDLIVTEAGAYRIDTTLASVDLDRFDALVGAARHDPSSRVLLDEAFALARRELFAGEPDEGVIARTRDQYRAMTLQVGLDAACAAAAAGDWRNTSSIAAELLAGHPTNEAACELAMCAAYRLGRRNDALVSFDRCRTALSEDLDCEPGMRLIELRGAIQRRLPESDLPDLGRVSGAVVDIRGDAAPPAISAAVSNHERCGGRAGAVRAGAVRELEAALRSGLDSFVVVAVEGEFGTGKSALLERVVAHPPAGFRHCERVVASDLFAAAPLAPLLSAVHGVIADDLDKAQIALGVAPGRNQVELLEHLVSAFRAHAPMLVVIDQFESADDMTARAIPYLRERCASAGGAILIAWDPSVTAAHLPHHDVQPDARVELGRCAPDELEGSDVDLMWERTGGLPILVEGLLEGHTQRALSREQPHDASATKDWSARLERQVVGRFRRLGDDAVSIATVAAALDEPFDAIDVARVLDRDPLLVLERCDAMMHVGILTAVDLRFAFRDVLVREILAAQASAARRLWIRDRVGLRPGSQWPGDSVTIASR